MDTKIILAILSSSVLSSLVTAVFTKKSNDQNHQVKYITQERQDWRQEIRETITDFCNTKDKDKLKKYRTYLMLRLNPQDNKDIQIIDLMSEIINAPNELSKKEELQWKVAALLKHDWERAKREVKSTINISTIVFIILSLYGYYLLLVRNAYGEDVFLHGITWNLFILKTTIYIVCVCFFLMLLKLLIKIISGRPSLKYNWLNQLFNIRE